MERKNMILLTVIGAATLLVAMVGATFAFFTATVQDTRSDESGKGTANITAGSVASKTVVGNVSGNAGKFTATDVYPNHKEVAGLSVTVTNEGETTNTNTNVDIVYNVTNNTFADKEILVNVYKKVTEEDPNVQDNYFGCTHDVQAQEAGNEFHFTETCTNDLEAFESTYSLEKLTSKPVELSKGASKDLVIASDTISAAEKNGTATVYYYVVVEFDETDESQNNSMNATLEGTINVKAA